MSVSRIAKRYAKPILELAEEKKQLDQVKDDMQQFADLCEANKDLVNLLKSPIIAHLKKAEILRVMFKGKMNDLTLTAFDIITRKNRESVLPDIAREFLTMYNNKMGYQKASVTTTFPLDAKLRKTFTDVVKDVTGKTPVLEESVDASLIGGYTLKLGDRQIDESVSGKLKELRLKFEKEK
jgi:F-type H+-transporting ATPase subunit delta